MKGRRKEITRHEVHDILKKQFQYSAGAFRIWNDGIVIAGICKSRWKILLPAVDESFCAR